MKRLFPIVVLLVALAAVLYSVFGSEGYRRLASLRRSVNSQRQRNAELEVQVGTLRRKVLGLQHDDRELEKAARDELGMARPDEMIFTFEEQKK